MNIKISELYGLKTFQSISLIAGKGGEDRTVTKVGLLDYELDKNLGERYIYENIGSGYLFLTTFLYAKDEDYLITKAINKLNERECSGLIIKNIYNLPLNQKVIRYADSLNFPVFVIDGNSALFEDIILEINAYAWLKNSLHESTKALDQILSKEEESTEVIQYINALNPSLENHFAAVFFEPSRNISHYHKQITTCCSSVHLYKDGAFYIHSSKNPNFSKDEFEIDFSLEKNVGVSNIHHSKRFFKLALQEAKNAFFYSKLKKTPYIEINDIGIYELILSNLNNATFETYSDSTLKKIREFDLEHNGDLMDTLSAYVLNAADLDLTAESLGVHKNTIKYRLNRIEDVTGLNYRKFEDMEILSISTKIHVTNKELQNK